MSQDDPRFGDTVHALRTMWSWQEFVDEARAPDSIEGGDGRHCSDDWAGASWDEALQLARDGWTTVLPEMDAEVAELRERVEDEVLTTALVPAWDVTGSEVDIGAYLSGEPECMVDAVPQRLSARGRVVTFLVPAGYTNTTPHSAIHNRGVALAALCSSITASGHSVEIWSAFGPYVSPTDRFASAARVISAAEPLDMGRLMFVMAHPAMLRRLWLAVWDSAAEPIAGRMRDNDYGYPPHDCYPEDLPEGITNPYVLPYLSPDDPQWETTDTALAWCREMFTSLGLLRA
ncbi:phage protein [Actinomadura vinacea]|uniref:Phage protein n=1 Tax=Actinomadura vinacea TaxID=115336 RepID=A0ABP5VC79_9ACTN